MVRLTLCLSLSSQCLNRRVARLTDECAYERSVRMHLELTMQSRDRSNGVEMGV